MAHPGTTPQKHSALARTIVRGTVWTGLGSYALQFMGFCANLVLVRLLPASAFGFLSMGTFWSGLLNLRPKLGLQYAAIQHPRTDGELLGTYYALDLIISFLSLTLGLVVAGALTWLSYPLEVRVGIVVLILADCLPALIGPLSMVLEKEIQLGRQFAVALLAYSTAYGVALWAALSGKGFWSLLAINTMAALVGAIGAYWLCRRRYSQVFEWRWTFAPELARQLLRVGLPTGLSFTAALTVVAGFDNFLVGTFAGYETLGFYDRAFRTAQWPNILLTTVIGRVGFLTFAKVQDDLPRLTHAVRLSLWVLYVLGVPMTLALAFGAVDVVHLLYGDAWRTSARYLPYLAVYALAGPLANIGFWLSVARQHTRTTLTLTLAQAATLILVGTPLTRWWGVTGTLVGVGLTNLVALGMSSVYVFRQVPLALRQTLGLPLLSAAVACLTLTLLPSLLRWDHWPALARLMAIGLTGSGIFWLVLWASDRAEMTTRLSYALRTFRGK